MRTLTINDKTYRKTPYRISPLQDDCLYIQDNGMVIGLPVSPYFNPCSIKWKLTPEGIEDKHIYDVNVESYFNLGQYFNAPTPPILHLHGAWF